MGPLIREVKRKKIVEGYSETAKKRILSAYKGINQKMRVVNTTLKCTPS